MLRRIEWKTILDESGLPVAPRYLVGTHYRVWWFWVPLILGGIALLVAAVLMPVARPLGVLAGVTGIGLLLWALMSHFLIVRGRRWLEYDETCFRLIDRHGVVEFRDDQVSDLAVFQVLHHAGGRLIAVSHQRTLWVETPAGPQTIRLTNRVSPHSCDPLEELFHRLRERLIERCARALAAQQPISGDGWQLDGQIFRVTSGQPVMAIPVESVTAVEIIGQQVRIWRDGQPRAAVRLPLRGRNTWILPHLLNSQSVNPHRNGHSVASPEPAHPLGRILFERTTGPAVSVLFIVLGAAVTSISVMGTILAIGAAEVIGVVIGLLFTGIGLVCLIAGIRVRRVRFCCHEHGLERVTLTGRQVLKFSEIDVFSFESRRNYSHGRYTGTTYTLVFADRSREQGRGIFFSTTVRNTDEELELLRERVAEGIARKMAAAFARSRRVQWTAELWFHEDVLEFSRPRRFLSRPKLAVVPYDTINDFEIRDGRFYIWTNYQERAVVNIRTSSPNFYPGVIVLEGLVNAHARNLSDEWSPSATLP